MVANDGFLAVGDTMKSFRDGHTIARGTPPSNPATVFGANVGDGNPHSTLATRLANLGRVPSNRGPYPELLSQYTPFPTSTFLTTRAPEKRMVISWNKGATHSVSNILAGGADAEMSNFAASVPSDWEVDVAMSFEPNAQIAAGTWGNTSGADYLSAVYYCSQFLGSLGSAAYVRPCLIMSAPKNFADGTSWLDSYMPTFSSMGNSRARFYWDNYSNWHGGAAGATPYDSAAAVTDKGYALLDSHGWTDTFGHWGYTEFNAAVRDFDSAETGKAAFLVNFIEYALARPMPPRLISLWEGNGTKFDQNIYQSATWTAIAPYWGASG